MTKKNNKKKQAKILIIDIESAPNIAYVWGAYKQNIGHAFFKEDFYLMSFAAKWLHSGRTIYHENRDGNDFSLVNEAVKLLDEADIVVAHNGKKFDMPMIQGRAAVHGILPPSPFKQVDTLLAARRFFRFPMNSLAYLTRIFECNDQKLAHAKFPGFELWLQCLKQNDEAWNEMKVYNIQDVIALEELYLKMRPWIANHPNVGVHLEREGAVCPKCGSEHIHYRGYYTTNISKFKRFQCQDCGGWGRTRHTEMPKDIRKNMAVAAL